MPVSLYYIDYVVTIYKKFQEKFCCMQYNDEDKHRYSTASNWKDIAH